jgi:hypothetical protein
MSLNAFYVAIDAGPKRIPRMLICAGQRRAVARSARNGCNIGPDALRDHSAPVRITLHR